LVLQAFSLPDFCPRLLSILLAAAPIFAADPAAQLMKSLSLRDKAAQLISMPCYGEAPSRRSDDYKKFRHWVRDLRIGGFIVNNRVVGGQVRNAEPHAMALFLNQMQQMSRLPLIAGGDFERGASMRVANTVRFPYAMAYGAANDLNATRALGAETAREARALGIHWVYAPDADVNNNPDNPIINIRSFGEDPSAVAKQAGAFIDGVHSETTARVLATAKHFPGHGDTSTDSHLGLPRVDASRERMDQIELIPFRAAIEHNVDSIMTAHLAVPAYEPESIPATVSKSIITGLLRQQLGFKGIVVTDAMDMQGLTKLFTPGEASVRALEAGVDMLLMPTDPDQAINAIVAAVRSGRISRKRLDQSVAKILNAKARLGLFRKRVVDLDDVSDGIDNENAEQLAQQIADEALTLVRNENSAFPFRNPENGCVVALSEGRFSQEGRRLGDEIHKRNTKTQYLLLDPSADEAITADVLQKTASCESVAVAAFVTVGAYRGNVALPDKLSDLVAKLSTTKPVILIALGNPYLLKAFPNVAAYLATFSPVPVSEAAVVRALFGEIPITGHMPVTIPGFAKIGDGIQLGAARSFSSK
jgi:beta-N-acetylhexosaminidase